MNRRELLRLPLGAAAAGVVGVAAEKAMATADLEVIVDKSTGDTIMHNVRPIWGPVFIRKYEPHEIAKFYRVPAWKL